MEKVTFSDVAQFKPAVDQLFRKHARLIARVIPNADIQHVGSTALSHGLTKGDLDIQVRVPAADFQAAKATLYRHYVLMPGGFTAADGISFKDDPSASSAAVHLTVIGGSCDIQWRFREMLRQRSDLRTRYDSIKRRFHGKSMSAYRTAKSRFFQELKKTAQYRRLKAIRKVLSIK